MSAELTPELTPESLTVGELLAAGAVVEVHGPPQTRTQLALRLYEAARALPTPRREDNEDDEGHERRA